MAHALHTIRTNITFAIKCPITPELDFREISMNASIIIICLPNIAFVMCPIEFNGVDQEDILQPITF